jgi:opacity protein-like surface antigen
MRKLFFVAALIVALGFVKPAMAQSDSKLNVVAGYVYDYTSVSVSGFGTTADGISRNVVGNGDPTLGFNYNGGFAQAEYKFSPSVGLVADFAGLHTTSNGSDLNSFTYTFGPRYSFTGNSRFTPFVEILLGGAYSSGNGISANAFAMGLGGGIDINVTDRIFVRPIEAAYTLTTFSYGANTGIATSQNGIRYDAGVGFRF